MWALKLDLVTTAFPAKDALKHLKCGTVQQTGCWTATNFATTRHFAGNVTEWHFVKTLCWHCKQKGQAFMQTLDTDAAKRTNEGHSNAMCNWMRKAQWAVETLTGQITSSGRSGFFEWPSSEWCLHKHGTRAQIHFTAACSSLLAQHISCFVESQEACIQRWQIRWMWLMQNASSGEWSGRVYGAWQLQKQSCAKLTICKKSKAFEFTMACTELNSFNIKMHSKSPTKHPTAMWMWWWCVQLTASFLLMCHLTMVLAD